MSAERMSPTQALQLRQRRDARATVIEMRDAPAKREKRGQKYGNTKIVDRGIKFDSKAEHKRWQYLAMLEKAGEIKNLQLQVPYELIPKQARPSGGFERPCVYIADFCYEDSAGTFVCEDVKGAATPEYRLKKKLLLFVHSIEIKEVRS